MCKRPLFLAGCLYLAVTAAAFLFEMVPLLIIIVGLTIVTVCFADRKMLMLFLSLATVAAAVGYVERWKVNIQEQLSYSGKTMVLEGMVTDCKVYDSSLLFTAQVSLGDQTVELNIWSYSMEPIKAGNRFSSIVTLEEKEKTYWYDGCALSAQTKSMNDLGMEQGIKAECLRLNSFLQEQIESLFHGKGREIMLGLLLGEKADLSQEVEQVFLKSGTLHLLTVSGFHFTIIASGFFVILRFLRQNPKEAALFSIPFLFMLAMIEGMTVSVTRAFIMLLFSYAAKILERDYDGLTAWSLTAMLILLPEPARLFSPSFLLSFSAVLGILLFGPVLTTILQRLLLVRINQYSRFQRIGNRVCQLCGVSIAANVLTAPFLLLFFGYLPLSSVLSSILTVPLLPAIMSLGIASILLPIQPIAAALAAAAQLLTGILYHILLEFSKLDLILYGEDHYLLTAMILLYVLLFLLYLLKADLRKKQTAVAAYLVGAALLVFLNRVVTPNSTELYVCRSSFVLCNEGRAIIVGTVEKESDREEIERVLHSKRVETVDLMLFSSGSGQGENHALELVKNWEPQFLWTEEEMDVFDVSGISYTASQKQSIEFWTEWKLTLSDGNIVLTDGERKFLKLYEKYAIIAAYSPEYSAILGNDYMVYGEEPLLWEKTWQSTLKLTLEDEE